MGRLTRYLWILKQDSMKCRSECLAREGRGGYPSMARTWRVTWTLRLYDANGVEIAWIRADPYEWAITHPDSGWRRLELSIRLKETPDEMSSIITETEEFTLVSDVVTTHDETPKDHLEWVQENLKAADGVASTTLVDE